MDIDREDRREDKSSLAVDGLAPASGESDGLFVDEVSKRATAAATPRRTARSRSGRSKMCEELGWRIYLCWRQAGWMKRPSG